MVVGSTPQQAREETRIQIADIFSYGGLTIFGGALGYYLSTDEKSRKGQAGRRHAQRALVSSLVGAGVGLALGALTNPWLRDKISGR